MPDFFVLARVVGSDGAFPKWKERLVPLCEVSATEPYSTSYYWGQDVDGEPDTLWGLEGYAHPIGFFLGHPASDVFKREMKKVDEDKLLRHVQGLGSPDYDLHYYDMYHGFLTRPDDNEKDSKDSFVVAIHFWAPEGRRKQLLGTLSAGVDRIRASEPGPHISIQSCAVLKECLDVNMASLYIRTRSRKDWESLQASTIFKEIWDHVEPVNQKSEIHQSQAFNGHIDQTPPIGQSEQSMNHFGMRNISSILSHDENGFGFIARHAVLSDLGLSHRHWVEEAI